MTVTTSGRRWAGGSALAAALLASGCISAPAPPPRIVPTVTAEQKMAWILRLEDRRILHEAAPPVVAPPPVAPRRGRSAAPVPQAPVRVPDLLPLLGDTDARIRRRAALAVGRVGLDEGVQPLVALLADSDRDVRAIAAFSLGLLGATSAVPPLITALGDADPRVRGRAAEALGLAGAQEGAGPIGQMVSQYIQAGALTAMKPDDDAWPGPDEASAVRLGLFALVRLKAYEPLAAAVLDRAGRPSSTWWPVAYALQRLSDPRGQAALTDLLHAPGRYSAAFAARGLGGIKAVAAVEPLAALAAGSQTPFEVRVSAIRALGQIGDRRGAAALVGILDDQRAEPNLKLEAVGAAGQLTSPDALPFVLDLLTDAWPAMRIAALRAAAAIDQEQLLLVLSGMDPDPQWLVRAALADAFAGMPAEVARPRLHEMLADPDKRVLPSVLRALVRLRAPEAADAVRAALKEPDFGVRAAASELTAQLRLPGAAEALREAYRAAQPDSAYDARVAALDALAVFGAGEALDTVREALTDRDWAVRLRAQALLKRLAPTASSAEVIRPAPGAPPAAYDDPALVAPSVSPHVFIDTPRGIIEIELAVLDAPQTARNFMALARRGYFNGLPVHRVVSAFVVQAGDSRGDGSGGPGYTIRDELNDWPFLRGTVGMALAGPDTGGSQFFITHSPQPHLDGKYTVFGHVVNGMDVVDRIQQGDVIQRVRVWDGTTMQ